MVDINEPVADRLLREQKILLDTADLLQKGWCQGNHARNELNAGSDIRDPQTCKWCMAGGIGYCAGMLSVNDHWPDELENFMDAVKFEVARELGIASPEEVLLGCINDRDDMTQERVVALVRKVGTEWLERGKAYVQQQPV